MLTYRSVFVTGAYGFVGRHLLGALRARLADDAIIHCSDRTGRTPVDLLDATSLRAAIAEARPDLVFHLAAQSSVGQAAGSGGATWSINVCGTLNLAEAIAHEAPDAVVAFASSSEVYGATFNTGIATEASPLSPLSVYARSKRAAEDVLHDALSATNRLLVFRPTNHSGLGQDIRFVLPAFADQIAAIENGRQAPVIKVGSLNAKRDILDVRDVVEAYLDALAVPDLATRDVLNVASGTLISMRHLLDELLSMTTAAIGTEQDPSRVRTNDIPSAAVDATRLRARTGWHPRYSLRDTILAVLVDRRLHHRSTSA